MDPTTRILMMGSSAAGDKYWISRLGGTGSDVPYGRPSVDSLGNVYIAGSTGQTTVDFFTAQLDSFGAVTWQRFLVSGSNDNGYECCIDSSSNVYTVGFGNISNQPRAQIVKYNSSGVIQWQYYFGASATGEYYFTVTADPSDNIYAAGQEFTMRGSGSAWIVKLNSAGSVIWQIYSYPVSQQAYVNSITTDASGNVYAAGQTYNNTYGNVCALTKLNSSGTVQWERQLAVSNQGNLGASSVVDSSGNVYFTGYGITGSYYVVIVAKYDSSGSLLWQRQLSSALGNMISNSIAMDSDGNVYVCGYGPTVSTTQLFIAKYNSSGSLQWQRTLDGSQSEVGYGITVKGNSIVVAAYSNTSPISGTLETLLLKVPTDGSLTGTYGPYTYSSSSYTESASSALSFSNSSSTLSSGYNRNTLTFTDIAGTLTNSVINIP